MALGSWGGTGGVSSGTASDGGIETVLATVPSRTAAVGKAGAGGSGALGLLCGCHGAWRRNKFSTAAGSSFSSAVHGWHWSRGPGVVPCRLQLKVPASAPSYCKTVGQSGHERAMAGTRPLIAWTTPWSSSSVSKSGYSGVCGKADGEVCGDEAEDAGAADCAVSDVGAGLSVSSAIKLSWHAAVATPAAAMAAPSWSWSKLSSARRPWRRRKNSAPSNSWSENNGSTVSCSNGGRQSWETELVTIAHGAI